MGDAPLRLEIIAVMLAPVAVADAEVKLDVIFVVAVVVTFAEFCVAELPLSPPLAVCEGWSDCVFETSETEVDEVVGPSRLCK